MMDFDVDDIKLGAAWAVLLALASLVVAGVSGALYIAARIVWAVL